MTHVRTSRLLLAAPLAALALLAAGCSETFVPASVVADHRVLALVAEPPEVVGTDPVAATIVEAVLAAPPAEVLAAGHAAVGAWTFCPFSLGASTAYACAVPQCEVSLDPGADGRVTVRPVQAALDCLANPLVVLPPELAGGALPPRAEVLVRYRLLDRAGPLADPPAADRLLREAVLRLPVWTVDPATATPPEVPNHNPRFADLDPVKVNGAAAVRCDPTALAACTPAGRLVAGAPLPLEVAVNPDSIETYPVGDRTASEAFSLSFFTTAGRFKDDKASATRAAPVAAGELRWESVPTPAPAQALLWVVLRDLRGGQAVEGPFLVTLGN